MKPFTQMIVVMLLVSVPLAGCSRKAFWTGLGLATIAAGGTAGYYYAKGDLESEEDYDLDEVFRAAKKGLAKMELPVEEETLNALNAVLKSQVLDPDDNKIKDLVIKLKKLESGATHVSIRVGVIGDEVISKRVLEAIQSNL